MKNGDSSSPSPILTYSHNLLGLLVQLASAYPASPIFPGIGTFAADVNPPGILLEINTIPIQNMSPQYFDKSYNSHI